MVDAHATRIDKASAAAGKDIMVLHVEPVASWTSYMVFVRCVFTN